jgi:hypothetical protein
VRDRLQSGHQLVEYIVIMSGCVLYWFLFSVIVITCLNNSIVAEIIQQIT